LANFTVLAINLTFAIVGAAYWRTRSEQTRTLAEHMTDEKPQRSLLVIANEYDDPAEFTEAQEHTADRRFGLLLRGRASIKAGKEICLPR